MNTDRQGLVRFLALFFLVSFILHLVWEFGVCGPFYLERRLLMTVASMLRVTSGDVGLTALIYVLVALCLRDRNWGQLPLARGRLALVASIGAVVTIPIEMHALANDRWSYSGLMPVVAGIGLLPVLQLALLTPLSLWIAQLLTRRSPSGVSPTD